MPTGRLRQSEVFFPLAIVAHHVVSPGICPGLIQNHPDHVFDRAIVIFDKVWRTSTMFASLWVARSSIFFFFFFYRTLKISLAEKNFRIREKSVYTVKRSDSKVFRFKFPILNTGFKISGDMTKPRCVHLGFVLFCVNGKTNPILKRSGFITSRE